MAASTGSQLPLSLRPVKGADQFLPRRHVPVGQHDRLDVVVVVILVFRPVVVVFIVVGLICGWGASRCVRGARAGRCFAQRVEIRRGQIYRAPACGAR